MTISLKEVTITLNEASGRNTYTHYVIDLSGPTLIKQGKFTYNIVALDWNDAGTSQLLVADNGQRFRLGDIEIMASREHERLEDEAR